MDQKTKKSVECRFNSSIRYRAEYKNTGVNMNPITKALNELSFRIPKRILELAFLPKAHYGELYRKSLVSVEYRIREEVIEARVLPDCNLVGGTEVAIPLMSVTPQYLPEFKVLWRIPLSLTQNRKITRVYSLVYQRPGATIQTNYYAFGGSIYDDVGSGLIASHAPIPNISNAELQLVGENTVVCNTQIMMSPLLYLRCVVENDKELNNLPPATIPRLCKLIEFAVKSYIYNKLIIDFDKGAIAGGVELGNLTSIVESYSDSETLYQEYLDEHWRKIAILSDPVAHKRHLKRITGGRF